jgi:hypothetical protein
LEKYHVKDTGLNYVITRRIGACLLWMFCVSWCLIFQNYSKYDAFGAGTWPWIIDGIGSTLNYEPKKYGFSPLTNLFMLAISVASILAMESENEDWKSIMIKISTAWWLLNGVGLTLLPSLGEKSLWKFASLDEESTFLLRICGFCCLANGIMVALIDQDIDAVRAMGYGFVALTAGLLAPFFVNAKHLGTTDVGQKDEKYAMVQKRHRYMLLGAVTLTMLMLRGELLLSMELMRQD